jgi:hypothetical protein
MTYLCIYLFYATYLVILTEAKYYHCSHCWSCGVDNNLIGMFVGLYENSPTKELLELLEKSVSVYSSEFKRFLSFLGEVFENSPFLISAEDAGIANKDDFKEAIIAAGKTHEVLVTVECEGSLVAWDFRLTAGKDVGFSVEFEDSSSTKRPMLPYHRYEAHQGNFCSPSIGTYKLIWDNTYSNFYRKIVRYKVDSIPPVLETNTSTDESPNSDATSYDE